MARTHAIKMNRRLRTANSSHLEFNVNALLKTTTGMTMEDLRQNMATLKSSRRQRALGASIDAVVSQFLPDDDSVSVPTFYLLLCCARDALNDFEPEQRHALPFG